MNPLFVLRQIGMAGRVWYYAGHSDGAEGRVINLTNLASNARHFDGQFEVCKRQQELLDGDQPHFFSVEQFTP